MFYWKYSNIDSIGVRWGESTNQLIIGPVDWNALIVLERSYDGKGAIDSSLDFWSAENNETLIDWYLVFA